MVDRLLEQNFVSIILVSSITLKRESAASDIGREESRWSDMCASK